MSFIVGAHFGGSFCNADLITVPVIVGDCFDGSLCYAVLITRSFIVGAGFGSSGGKAVMGRCASSVEPTATAAPAMPS